MEAVKTPTILVVDDIASNRALVAEILRINDYTVLEAAEGVAAQRVSDEYPGPIQLLIADLVMPGLNGIELARRLRPSRPEMRTLYISGYHADVDVHLEVWEARAEFLTKPFSPMGLLGKVMELLGKSYSDRQA